MNDGKKIVVIDATMMKTTTTKTKKSGITKSGGSSRFTPKKEAKQKDDEAVYSPPVGDANNHQSPTTTTSSRPSYEELLIPLLTRRSFHLPGNTRQQDWWQWMANNHLIFGIWCHHPLHPIETWERIVVLSGSIAFALVACNIAYVWDWSNGTSNDFNPHHILYSFTLGGGEDANYEEDAVDDTNQDTTNTNGMTINITYGMLLLWTFGCTFHSLFDLCIWNVSACACFHPGGRYGRHPFLAQHCRDVGSYLLIPVVLALLGLAGYSSYLRVTNTNRDIEDLYEDDLLDVMTDNKLGDFAFLIRFSIELLLTWFVFFPLLSTILFTGILGCYGRLPVNVIGTSVFSVEVVLVAFTHV